MAASTDARIAELFEKVKDWGRWGPEDQRGRLNLLTAAEVARAGALVTDGTVVSCAHDLPLEPTPDNPVPTQHFMTASGDALGATGLPGFQQTTDFLGVACHGMGITHIDALCHMFVGDHMYNGFPASDVTSTGAERNSIAAAAGGIVGRGVLLDIPLLRGSRYLEPDDRIGPADLERAEAAEGLEVRAGDILIVRTGREARREEQGPAEPFAGMAGLDAECLTFLHERDVAVLGGDGISDVLPPNFETPWPFPIHQCGITAMGLHLIDNLAVSGLAAACEARNRWEFLFSVCPLRAAKATGSPVNPVAVF